MVTLFGTLGFTPEKFYPSLRQRADVEQAVVFHDTHEDSKAAVRSVAKYCRDLGVPLKAVRVDAFDLVASATVIRDTVRSMGPGPAVFNVTGGTKVLAAGALLTCILEGIPAVYIHDMTNEEVALPLVRIPYEQLLTREQKGVLDYIDGHEDCSQTDIRDALGISKPTVSHHVQSLVAHGLVVEGRDPQDARKKRLRLVPGARLLLGGDRT